MFLLSVIYNNINFFICSSGSNERWTSQTGTKNMFGKYVQNTRCTCKVSSTVNVNKACVSVISCSVVASSGLRNRDTWDFSLCVMSDADVEGWIWNQTKQSSNPNSNPNLNPKSTSYFHLFCLHIGYNCMWQKRHICNISKVSDHVLYMYRFWALCVIHNTTTMLIFYQSDPLLSYSHILGNCNQSISTNEKLPGSGTSLMQLQHWKVTECSLLNSPADGFVSSLG